MINGSNRPTGKSPGCPRKIQHIPISCNTYFSSIIDTFSCVILINYTTRDPYKSCMELCTDEKSLPCDNALFLDLHGLIFEISLIYWQDRPGFKLFTNIVFSSNFNLGLT